MSLSWLLAYILDILSETLGHLLQSHPVLFRIQAVACYPTAISKIESCFGQLDLCVLPCLHLASASAKGTERIFSGHVLHISKEGGMGENSLDGIPYCPGLSRSVNRKRILVPQNGL